MTTFLYDYRLGVYAAEFITFGIGYNYFSSFPCAILLFEPLLTLIHMITITAEILYQNEAKDITIVDLPTSIALAQTLPAQPFSNYALYSSSPLQEPYKSLEPKSPMAKANLLSKQGQDRNTELDRNSHLIIHRSLDDIRKNYHGSLCLPRQLSPFGEQKHGKKRKFDDLDVVSPEPDLSELQKWERFGRKFTPQSSSVFNLPAVSERYVLPGYQALSHRVVCNPQSRDVFLITPDPKTVYRVPPLATFYLAGIDNQTATWFSQSVSKVYSTPTCSAGPGQFDFILLDPPWENRSVTRSQKYKTAKGCNPLSAVQAILGQHIAPKGIVACWVTSKAGARMAALEAFGVWNVDLIEEWTWLKITAKGEPVYDVEGLWRKPYELLLIGRKRDEDNVFQSNLPKEVRHRFLAAVPDVHSRKPCLKSLIAPMMLDPQDYRALEIFARNLTAGWWAWGDEVLKFNWQGHWKKVKHGENKTNGKSSKLELAQDDEIEAMIEGCTTRGESTKDGSDQRVQKMAKIR